MEVISQEWTESDCAQLPLEIWERIVAEITDSRYHARAWLHLRCVSRTLKAATEHVFATQHLPAFRVEFKPLTLRPASIIRNPEVVGLSLKLESLSENGERAVFSSKQDFEDLKNRSMGKYVDGATHSVHDALARLFRRQSRAARPCPSVEDIVPPHHCIIAYRDVNDTELPGLEFDLERFKVSFLWKPMLSMFYGESEYEKWADKVLAQHAARSDEGVMPEAFRLGEAVQNKRYERVQELLRFVTDKMEKQQRRKTRVIRTKRFKRMLQKMDYQEKGEDLDEYFQMCGRANFVERVKDSLAWEGEDEDDDDDDFQEERERFEGCFYDGMGMDFDGKRELNKPGECSDDEDEWEDEDGFSD